MRHHIHPLSYTARELTLVNATADSSKATQRIHLDNLKHMKLPSRFWSTWHSTRLAIDWRGAECCSNKATKDHKIAACTFYFTEET
jgi:hypothetical protein